MPQVIIELSIEHVEKPVRAYSNQVSITDNDAVQEVAALGFEFKKVGHGGIFGFINVITLEGDPRIQQPPSLAYRGATARQAREAPSKPQAPGSGLVKASRTEQEPQGDSLHHVPPLHSKCALSPLQRRVLPIHALAGN